MSRQRVAAAAAALLLVMGVALIAAGGPAGADGGPTPSATGWWWQAQRKSLPLPMPMPPGVAKGQLVVQGAPNDKSAFSALRYTLPEGQTNPKLTLTVAPNGDAGGDRALLLACRTGSAWSAADAGPWEDAPTIDKETCVNGQRAADGTTWSFALGPLQLGSLVDIALVPGIDTSVPAPTTSTFQLVFAAPAPGALTTTAGQPPAVPPPTTAAVAPVTGDGFTPAPASGGGTFRAPAPVAPAVAPALPTDKVGQTATAPAQRAATEPTVAVARATDDAGSRIAGIVVLLLAGVAGAYAYGQQRAARRAGSTLAVEAGLGRYVAARTGTPPSLR